MSLHATTKTESDVNVSFKEKISRLEIWSYSLGQFGSMAAYTVTISFLAYFYTDVMGIAAGFVGTLFLIMRIWDGVADVAMGSLVDRTTTKYGKARPYLLWLCVPYGLFCFALFTVPPTFSTAGKYAYIIIIFSIFNLVYTGVEISLKTLLGQITQDQESRTKLGIGIAYAQLTGNLVVAVSAEPIASAIGGQLGWVVVAGLAGLIVLSGVYATFRFTKERVGSQTYSTQEKRNPLKLEIKALFQNRYWIIMSMFAIVLYIFFGLASAEIYYAKNIFGDAGFYSFVAMAQMIPAILFLVVATPFIKRMGKQKATILGAIFIILDGTTKLLDPTSMTHYLIGSAFYGIGTGLISATMYAMVNDTVDYGEWKTKVRTPGLANSSVSFGMKVGTGLGGAMMGWLLSLGGYVGTASVQTDAAIQMIKFLNIHAHIILGALMLIIVLFYKLDKQYPQIIADLQKNDSIS